MVTAYFRNLILENIFHADGGTPLPSAYYVALSSTIPDDTGGNISEISGGAYARAIMNHMGISSDGVIVNTQDVEFPESTADWGTAKAFAVYDSASGGNLLMFDSLARELTIIADNQGRFKPGELKITLQNVT